MAIFSELRQQVEVLDDLLGERADELADAMRGLSDEQLVAVVEAGARATRCLGRIEAVGAGIVAERSRREAGQQGLVQVRGHRSPAEFVQAITGTSKSDARQRIRVGQSVLEAGDGLLQSDPSAVATGDASATPAWHAPLADALMRGRVSSAQSDAIRRGLGEPPADPSGHGR